MNAIARAFADLVCKDDELIKLRRHSEKQAAEIKRLRCIVDWYKAKSAKVKDANALAIRQIMEAIAVRYGVTPDEITSKTQARDISKARQAVMYEASLRGISGRQIARFFGYDHSTVIHGIRAEKARRKG